MPRRIRSHEVPVCTVGRRETHKVYDTKRYADPVLGPVARFRSSVAWQRKRKGQMAKHPLCCDPFDDHKLERGATVAAEGVHHVVALAERLDLGLVDANLRSLCWECHNRVESVYKVDRYKALRLFLTEEQERVLLATRTLTSHRHPGQDAQARREATEGRDDVSERALRDGSEISTTDTPAPPHPTP